jgi:signal transduction histidine kinase
MRQLFQNLIANALKFHKEEEPPVVEVSGEMVVEEEGAQGPTSAGARWQITIEDNGIGFDEKYLERVFDVFQRLHGPGAYEGTGIGLAICRKIADRHGGAITATSQPGRGSTFMVTLPVQRLEEGGAK